MENDVSIADDTLTYCSCTLRMLAELVHDTDNRFADIELQFTDDSDIYEGKVTCIKGLGSYVGIGIVNLTIICVTALFLLLSSVSDNVPKSTGVFTTNVTPLRKYSIS
jgi:hypothetical protein